MRTTFLLRSAAVWCTFAPVAFANAQSEEDALRLSYIQPHGGARSAAMANAFGALGADPVSAFLNPAGMGLYVASEFTFTPAFEVNEATSTFYGTSASNTDTRFCIGNFGLVLHSPTEEKDGWKAASFGIIYDRQASFHWERQAVGDRVNSTILSGLVNEANGTDPDLLYDAFPFTSGLAWDTYAIDPLDTNANTYVSVVPQGALLRQAHTIGSSGAVTNTTFYFAANRDDRLYLGGSLGIVGVRYSRTTIHHETTLDESIDIKDITFREDLTTRGTGVDLKIGAIYRPIERLRLGLAFHTPTWLSLTDAYTTEMSTAFRAGDSYSRSSPDGSYAYRLNTPLSVLGSVAYVVGQHGAVSIDYQWKDYRKARFRRADAIADDYDFSAENAVIEHSGEMSHSVRVGTEWRAGPWYFRGGWGFHPDPFSKEDLRHGLPLTQYALGVGWRNTHISLDLGGTYAQRGSNYFPYDPAEVDAVNEDLTSTRLLVTFAYRP